MTFCRDIWLLMRAQTTARRTVPRPPDSGSSSQHPQAPRSQGLGEGGKGPSHVGMARPFPPGSPLCILLWSLSQAGTPGRRAAQGKESTPAGVPVKEFSSPGLRRFQKLLPRQSTSPLQARDPSDVLHVAPWTGLAKPWETGCRALWDPTRSQPLAAWGLLGCVRTCAQVPTEAWLPPGPKTVTHRLKLSLSQAPRRVGSDAGGEEQGAAGPPRRWPPSLPCWALSPFPRRTPLPPEACRLALPGVQRHPRLSAEVRSRTTTRTRAAEKLIGHMPNKT